MATSATAHSPLFPSENHSIADAKLIEDPAKSFAIYHGLEGQEAAYYKFDMKSGGRILLQVLIPTSPEDGFVPGLALLIPGTELDASVPPFVEVPTGYGAIVALGNAGAEGELEPFSPGPVFMLAEIDVIAPDDGTYYALVFSNEVGGNYAIAVGYVEGFTAEEILLLPLSLLTIYQWEGQELWMVLLPYILVVATGLILAVCGYRRMGKPDRTVKWLAMLSSLAFLGSTANILAQLLFTFARVPLSSPVIVSLLFAFAYLALGLVGARFAYKRGKNLDLSARVIFLSIALVGFVMWGGFYIGPALALVIAISPPYKAWR